MKLGSPKQTIEEKDVAVVTTENPLNNAPTPLMEERRRADRFPIQRDLRYKVLNKKYTHESGTGKTINISSNGILFSTDQLLLPGRRVEVSVSWPAHLDNKCSLRLVARGKIVRFERGTAAMEIHQYEFRTAGLAGNTALPEPQSASA